MAASFVRGDHGQHQTISGMWVRHGVGVAFLLLHTAHVVTGRQREMNLCYTEKALNEMNLCRGNAPSKHQGAPEAIPQRHVWWCDPCSSLAHLTLMIHVKPNVRILPACGCAACIVTRPL